MIYTDAKADVGIDGLRASAVPWRRFDASAAQDAVVAVLLRVVNAESDGLSDCFPYDSGRRSSSARMVAAAFEVTAR